jgi:hypothetical protein
MAIRLKTAVAWVTAMAHELFGAAKYIAFTLSVVLWFLLLGIVLDHPEARSAVGPMLWVLLAGFIVATYPQDRRCARNRLRRFGVISTRSECAC